MKKCVWNPPNGRYVTIAHYFWSYEYESAIMPTVPVINYINYVDMQSYQTMHQL